MKSVPHDHDQAPGHLVEHGDTLASLHAQVVLILGVVAVQHDEPGDQGHQPVLSQVPSLSPPSVAVLEEGMDLLGWLAGAGALGQQAEEDRSAPGLLSSPAAPAAAPAAPAAAPAAAPPAAPAAPLSLTCCSDSGSGRLPSLPFLLA